MIISATQTHTTFSATLCTSTLTDTIISNTRYTVQSHITLCTLALTEIFQPLSIHTTVSYHSLYTHTYRYDYVNHSTYTHYRLVSFCNRHSHYQTQLFTPLQTTGHDVFSRPPDTFKLLDTKIGVTG